MISSTTKVFVFVIFGIFYVFFIGNSFAEINKNSIIKKFCIESLRKEVIKANLIYSEIIANSTCDCYLNEFLKTTSHQKAITKCKLEAQDKFNL